MNLLFRCNIRLLDHNLLFGNSFSNKNNQIFCLAKLFTSAKLLKDLTEHHGTFLEKEFPEHFKEGKYIEKVDYQDFVQMAMDRMDELGKSKDLQVYKDLLNIFPKGRLHPRNSMDLIVPKHPFEQNLGIQILWKMELNLVKPDKEMEQIILDVFTRSSLVWEKIAYAKYWTSKGRHVDTNPVPDILPEQTHQIAKIAMLRMIKTIDRQSILTVTNTSRFPQASDKTWIVSCQSPNQQNLIANLSQDSILRVEEGGLTYVNDNYLSYYVLKVYGNDLKMENDETLPKIYQRSFNANRLRFSFYEKPIKEKLYDLNHMHHTCNYQILATGMTGTSSHNSLVSWILHLQDSNPNLKNLSIMFNENEESKIDFLTGKPAHPLDESHIIDVDKLARDSLYREFRDGDMKLRDFSFKSLLSSFLDTIRRRS